MRALVVDSYGGPEVLRVADLPVPQPGPGEVRVRVTASAVNPADLWTRAGVLAGMLPAGAHPPYVLGWDLAGVVEAVGPDVDGLAAGQRVIGMADWFETAAGTQAEQVVLEARSLAPAPTAASPEAASTLPLNGLTALQALDLLDLPAGATLLVSGAAGGVGGYAVELAVHRGLRVLAYAAQADAELVRGLGAELVVRSEEPSMRGARVSRDDPVTAAHAVVPGGADGVLDAAAIGPALIGAVRDRGAFLAVTDPTAPSTERGVRVEKVNVRGNAAQLGALARLVDEGRLTLRVADVLSLDQAGDAHRRLEKGGVRGRLVLVP